jgi:NTP pyrophosphatase (non-canonical NTP hydrolase)
MGRSCGACGRETFAYTYSCICRPLDGIAEAQATEVERIWPTPTGQDPVLRQVAALTEEVGEIARAVLKRSHASRTTDGTHKGLTVDEWTEEVALEIGQALGVLLGLAHQEGVHLDDRMAATIDALRARPSIVQDAASGRRPNDGD